jgi:hypothetical protein
MGAIAIDAISAQGLAHTAGHGKIAISLPPTGS